MHRPLHSLAHRWLFFLSLILALAGVAQALQYDVTNSNDSGSGSLRAALVLAAGSAGPDTVAIQPASVTAPIVITSTTLFVNSTIILEGNGATLTTAANTDLMELTAGSDGSVIRNLAFQRTNDVYSPKLILVTSNQNTITHCRIGTDWAGGWASDRGTGIWVTGWGNLIGGNRATQQHNVISGNWYGLIIDNTSGGNTVCGNVVGLSADQATSNQNAGGIMVWGVGNAVGLPQSGQGNVVCNNQQYGIQIYGGKRNTVRNNLVGISEAGTLFGNQDGIDLMGDAYSNLIGGARNAGLYERNVISGNVRPIVISGGGGNTVSGNFINTNLSGTAAAISPSENVAVEIGTRGNCIGGSESDPSHLYGNVLLARDQGIAVYQDENRILGNHIGTLLDGSVPSSLDTGIYFGGVASGWLSLR